MIKKRIPKAGKGKRELKERWKIEYGEPEHFDGSVDLAELKRAIEASEKLNLEQLLETAIGYGQLEVVKYLIKVGADFSFFDDQTFYGTTEEIRGHINLVKKMRNLEV